MFLENCTENVAFFCQKHLLMGSLVIVDDHSLGSLKKNVTFWNTVFFFRDGDQEKLIQNLLAFVFKYRWPDKINTRWKTNNEYFATVGVILVLDGLLFFFSKKSLYWVSNYTKKSKKTTILILQRAKRKEARRKVKLVWLLTQWKGRRVSQAFGGLIPLLG